MENTLKTFDVMKAEEIAASQGLRLIPADDAKGKGYWWQDDSNVLDTRQPIYVRKDDAYIAMLGW